MDETVFLRLLREENKGEALLDAIKSARNHEANTVHRVRQGTFSIIPGSSFAYWVSDAFRRKFSELPALEANFGQVRVGLQTSSDFRFLRAGWEILPQHIARSMAETLDGLSWVSFAKGGEYSPYHADIHLLANWKNDGLEMKAWADPLYEDSGWSRIIKSPDFYFRPGLTWPSRTISGLSVRIMPAGCLFAHKGPAMFAPDELQLMFLLALTNSLPARAFVDVQMASVSYEVGILQRLPVPPASKEQVSHFAVLAREIYKAKLSVDSSNETSHLFVLPSVLKQSGESLGERLAAWNVYLGSVRGAIEAAQREIDEICYQLYDISSADRTVIETELGTEVKGLPLAVSPQKAAEDLLSWATGVVMGRFDVRLATGARPIPDLGDPFVPLPAYSPGMLPDGEVPADYALRVAEDGILIEDEGHDDDIVHRVREVFQLLWGERAEAIEREALEMLGAKSLREYFSRTGKGSFWDAHVSRYSKSRRVAPIYWLLQSSRGSYSVWLYCHKLTRDTVPKVPGQRYLGGRIQRIRHEIETLRPTGKQKPGITKKEERRLSEFDDLLAEIEDFEAKLKAVVQHTNERNQPVGYQPVLDDGVVLAAAPLHELIPWPRRVKRGGRQMSELAAYWEDLAAGKYDWAQVAMLYWSDRVTDKCKKDKSFALAHGLDEQFFPGLRDELHRQAPTESEESPPDDEEMTQDENDE